MEIIHVYKHSADVSFICHTMYMYMYYEANTCLSGFCNYTCTSTCIDV